MQMSEASRQIIYATVIVAMLLVYGRADKIASRKESYDQWRCQQLVARSVPTRFPPRDVGMAF
jgi:hypothetical protein